MRAPLQVIEGLRSANDVQHQFEAPLAPQPQRLGPLPEGFVEYQSFTGALFLHLADSHKLRDADTGAEYIRPGIDLRFEMGIARTDDPEIMHRCEGCPPDCKLHARKLPAHRGYGVGQLFWRTDVMQDQAKRVALKREAKRIKDDPEYAANVLQALEDAGMLKPPANVAENANSMDVESSEVPEELIDDQPVERKGRRQR